MNEAAELYDLMIELYYQWQADVEDESLKNKFLDVCQEFAYNDYPNPFRKVANDPSPIVPDGMSIITSVVR